MNGILKYNIIVLLGATSYGLLSTIVTFAYEYDLRVGDISAMQVFTGTLFLWIVILLKSLTSSGWKISASKTNIKNLLLTGVPVAITNIVYYKAVQLTSVSMAILLLFQFTWIGNLLECIIEKKRPTKSKLISMAILIFGTVLASNILSESRGFNMEGTIYGLMSGVSYSVFILVNGRVATKVDPLLRTGIMLIGTSICILAIFPPSYLSEGITLARILKFGVPLGVLGGVIPPLFFSIGIPRVGVGNAAILCSIELPVAMLAGMALLGEKVSIMQWVGVLIILAVIASPILVKMAGKIINKKELIVAGENR